MLDFFGNKIDEDEGGLSRVKYTNDYSGHSRRQSSEYLSQNYSYAGKSRKSQSEKPYSQLFLFAFYVFSLFWLEFDLRIAFSDKVFGATALFNILLFTLPVAAILFMLSSLFTRTINYIISIVLETALVVLFGSQIVYHKIFEVYYTMYQATTQGEALQFVDTIMSSILKSIIYLIIAIKGVNKLNNTFCVIRPMKQTSFKKHTIKFLLKLPQ